MGDSMSWEPEPFSRIIWRWKVPYKYRTIVSRANRLAHWVEYEAVKRGLRKCDVVHIHPRDLPQRVREIMKDGLVWLPIRTMKSVSGFAHKFYQPSSLDETLYYGVVAHSMDEAKAFLEAHQQIPCDHETIGELLGYPKCLTPDTLIPTENGLTPICLIREQTKLLDGSQVIATMRRPYNGYLIEVKPALLPSIKLTPEHPVLVTQFMTGENWGKPRDFVWKEAKDLTSNDRVLIKKVQLPSYRVVIDFDKLIALKRVGNSWFFAYGNNEGAPVRSSKTLPNIHGKLEVDENFMQLLGWYLAEGHSNISKAEVKFALGNEQEVEEVVKLIENVFDLEPTVRERETAFVVTIYSRALARFWHRVVGSKAHNKRLPYFSWIVKPNLVRALFEGYAKGDGWITEKKISITSVSKRLLQELQLLLLWKLGIPSSLSVGKPYYWVERRKVNAKTPYHLHVLRERKNDFCRDLGDYYALKIRKLSKVEYSGYVYNLETTTRTYSVPFTVHNCCREFFCKTFPRGELDPVHLVDSSKGQDPMLCISLRYFGLKIIPFFPCSFNCPKAKQFAEQWYKLMLEKDPFTAKGILELLTMPHKWSMVNAIIEVVTPLFIGICNGYVRYQKAELYWKGDPEYWKKKLPLQWHWYQYSLGKRPSIKELKLCMQS